MNTLDWDQLKEDRCPSCGMAMEITDKEYKCTNHRGNPFVIPLKRAIEIKRDLSAQEDCTLSWI